jgi:fumarylacetoacetase
MHPNDPALRSFIEVAPDCDFPIQNLPYGVFSTSADPTRRVGVAIGDFILDLSVLEKAGLVQPAGTGAVEQGGAPLVLSGAPLVLGLATLNPFMAMGPAVWKSTRSSISQLLRHDEPTLRDNAELRARCLIPMKDATMHLPIKVSDFTDFYSSKEHATNVGTMFRDKTNPLLPNWLHIPIGYNGRASTVVISGTPVRRPMGQLKGPQDEKPRLGPCAKLDFELEMGVIIGQPSVMGEMLSVEQAEAMIFGFTLLNDWSARDIQQWEYVPLGPFQAKAFATSISPWVVTKEALEPFRVEGPQQEPQPLPYLQQKTPQNYDVTLDVGLRTAAMKTPQQICRTNFSYMYWSSVQQLVHHASSGCAMNVADLLGSGTISGPEKSQRGSLLELSWNGTEPLSVGDEKRTFLADGDELVMRGWCQGKSYRVGFGAVAGVILPARSVA